ncbi:ATP-dependent Clp protease ATP-binding subunit [Bacteroides uniformis]|uniref:ATP-dependent Clp protease ATP-binding subunit n=3 Tax=Bacteroidaceae TaxID=815 RepID=A0A6I0ZND5_PHOVU|nr:ATP-dependent Clp protease ATP-binding subunit [Bacteroides uniformis]KAB6445525.1 ATP-dependent Clp protease ATP-binding subunit [Phocaeicola vulgatus]KAB3913285.1 ATP-dependent Clp protease ATP-binding subunit [Bacteroides uniformis]KAB3926178.1 ATP-dependent Clp protease ATP-binding subunit [Bacteroides uniformis]KAB3926272.1 ATP-dependent Clp protease ATP-binding subunit [Bacteroides uniformis]KAB3936444.1 ATP-dependent Clp protease ATP-binding subunit [Bacteroides uniformis]
MDTGVSFINLDDSVKIALNIAQAVARENANEYYMPSHLLKALLHKDVGLRDFIISIGKDLGYLEEWADVYIEQCPKSTQLSEIKPSEKIDFIFRAADDARIRLGLFDINPICVLIALVKPGVAFSSDQLRSFPIQERDILSLYVNNTENPSVENHHATSVLDNYGPGIGSSSYLSKYCIDLMAAAPERLLPVINRDRETRMVMEVLGSRSKSNVLIVGDAGVGKTALVYGLAWDIVNKKVPSFLEGARIFELDNASLIAGATYKGEIEDRLKNVLKELRHIENSILFIDEIHVLLDSRQGNSGAGNILKPELSRGDLTVIGATTIDEYRKIIEPDHAFSRRFEVVQVNEPDLKSAIQMLHSVKKQYTDYHHVGISDTAAAECVRLAKRYVKERRLPDSAIGLLDMTLSAIKMVNETGQQDVKELLDGLDTIEKAETEESEKVEDLKTLLFVMRNRLSPILQGVITDETDVNELQDYTELKSYLLNALNLMREFAEKKIEEVEIYEVAAVVASRTGIPIGKVQSQEKERLLNMEDYLRRRVVGQDQALKTLTDAILESRSGMNKPGQPIGSFFLLGPTGTGKTELAKALAETLFNDEKSMIRFDMSEFKEEHSAALLYGAPPGYVGYEEGGMLVNKIRQQPYAVVLFDEIEKAHPSVYDIFLQIMDEGKLHDRLGKEGDFSNSIILFTSNVGSEWLTKQLESGSVPSTTQIMEVMGRHFRPEFLARLSEIVPFSPISEDILLMIFDIQFNGLRKLLDRQGIAIEISDDARKLLAHKGFTPKYGARQVAGVIRNYLRRPISRLIIKEELSKGKILKVGLDDANELTWDIH